MLGGEVRAKGETMLGDLADPKWWLSAVIVGLLINLASAYLKHPADRLFRFIASRYRDASSKAKARWEQRLQQARESDRALLMEIAREQRHRSQILLSGVVGFGTVVLGDYMLAKVGEMDAFLFSVYGVGCAYLLAAIVHMIAASEVRDLVMRAAEKP